MPSTRKHRYLLSGAILALGVAIAASFLLRDRETVGEDDEENPFAEAPNQGPDGPFQQRNPDGSSIFGGFSAGRREGAWMRTSSGGAVLIEAEYVEGQLEGTWSSFYEQNGQVRETGQYVGGLAEGSWRMYYPNGALFEIVEHKAGKAHGAWSMHHPDGALADSMTWQQGLQVGTETNYSPEGRVIAQGDFQAHQPSGTWTCMDPDGSTRRIPAPTERLTPRQACGFGNGPEEAPSLLAAP
ncbi:MAG: hypothetical protein VX498_03480 [Myxococcota bacterium]|nr:hypothetical protein [Myxococcota bacterium]